MRALIAATAVVVLSAGLARAQYVGLDAGTGDGRTGSTNSNFMMVPLITGYERTPEQAGREYEIDRQYKETLKTKIPDKKPADPWRKMRAPAAAVDRHRPQ